MTVSTISSYQDYLRRLPISEHTRRNYLARVKGYLRWLESTPDSSRALLNAQERDFFVRDYKVHLLQNGRTAGSVNAILGSLDNFHLYLGLGKAKVRRQDLPSSAPKALTKEEESRLMKTVMLSPSRRNSTIIILMLHAGLRIAEVAALNVGDVFLTARKGEILVRCGKGNKQRRVPLNSELRETMLVFMSGPKDPEEPLFKSQKGNRLSIAAIDHLVRQFATAAGIEMSAHSLRHTMITKLIRAGCDTVLVAQLVGHSRLETTRRYALPTREDEARAMEKLCNAV